METTRKTYRKRPGPKSQTFRHRLPVSDDLHEILVAEKRRRGGRTRIFSLAEELIRQALGIYGQAPAEQTENVAGADGETTE